MPVPTPVYDECGKVCARYPYRGVARQEVALHRAGIKSVLEAAHRLRRPHAQRFEVQQAPQSLTCAAHGGQTVQQRVRRRGVRR